MTNFSFKSYPIARTRTQASVVANPVPQPKLWSTELFQLSAMGAVLALLMLWASISKKQLSLTTARMANRWDKLNATNNTFKHLQVTASGKCNPSAGWCGTPQYKYKFLGRAWASRLQVILHNTIVSRSHGRSGASTSVSKQIHQVPLISVDQIERFPQGKAIISNPGYGDKNDTRRPLMGRIGVPTEDIERSNQAQSVIWFDKIRPALAERKKELRKYQQQQNCVDLSQLNNKQKQDWTTEQLQLRLVAAEELLPMPPGKNP